MVQPVAGLDNRVRSGAVSLIATRLRLVHDGQKWTTSGGKRLLLGQRGQASDLVSFTIDEVALRAKMIVKRGVDGNEFFVTSMYDEIGASLALVVGMAGVNFRPDC